jgi:hypothetical protein
VSSKRLRVVAVEPKDEGAPLEAILLKATFGPTELIRWWGGYASESLDTQLEQILGDPAWRAYEMDLPDDWEEGYLTARAGVIRFEYGNPPAR